MLFHRDLGGAIALTSRRGEEPPWSLSKTFERFSVVRVRSEHGQGDCLPLYRPARFVKNFSATSSTVIVYLT
jgi:hypothetical protein